MSLDVHPQLLRALRTVLETGSLTATAERLGFSQSAVSKQISALETAAGVQLLHRVPRGVEPTEAGRRLAVRAAAVLDQLAAAGRELDASADPLVGRVTLGGFPASAVRLIPATLVQLRVEHPAVQVQFQESSTPVQLRRLRAGRLDLAVIAVGPDLPDTPGGDIEIETLPSGSLLVVVGARHRLAGRDRVDVAELRHEDWIVGRGARGEPQFGAWPTVPAPRVVAELSAWSARLGFVAAGLGITTIPTMLEHALPSGVVVLQVTDPGLPRRSLVLAHRGRLDTAAAAVRTALIHQAGLIAGGRGAS